MEGPPEDVASTTAPGNHANSARQLRSIPNGQYEGCVEYNEGSQYPPLCDGDAQETSGAFQPDTELRQLEEKVYAMDAELVKLQEMTADAKTHEDEPEGASASQVEGGEGTADNPDEEMNRRSVYVGNVDYGSTPQELQEHFDRCGKIFRVTIMVDKYTGHPKGFAYIEFADASAANNALMLSNTTLRGRPIKVLPKRKNIAGMTRGRPYGRGRGRGNLMFAGPYGIPPGFMGPPMRGGFPRGGAVSAYAPKYRRGVPIPH